jgi:hypothetical protein
METSFQEFLRQKTEGSNWKDRGRNRQEWLDALTRLFDQIRAWIREADPEGVLELVSYQVQRVEDRLGVYDAPAMKIRLNLDFVDIQPMGRFAIGTFSFQQFQALWRNEQKWGDLSGGRVDMTDGERRYILLRSITDGRDCWYAVPGDRDGVPAPFDARCLQAILQDLWK